MKLIRTGRCVLALLLALTLLAGVAALAVETETPATPAADPTDAPAETAEEPANEFVTLTGDCSITLHFGEAVVAGADADDDAEAAEPEETAEPDYDAMQSEAAAQELAETAVKIAVFKLADAVEQTGYDAYTFDFTTGDFAALQSLYSDEMSDDAVKALRDAAKDAIVASAGEIGSTKKADKPAGSMDDVTVDGLEAGMYLVLLYTEGQDYGTVQTDSFEYTYSPILVSVPTRESAATIGTKEDQILTPMTSDRDAWAYDVTVNVENKGEWVARLGSIYIAKSYSSAPVSDETCIFEVTATQYGETIFNNVYSIHFDAGDASQKILEVSGLPVGAQVTVKEVYAGAGAAQDEDNKNITDNTVITVVPGDTAADSTVEFLNIPGVTPPEGGSIINKYVQTTSGQGDGAVDWPKDRIEQLQDSMPTAQ